MYIIGMICLALVHSGQGTPSFGTVSIGAALISEGGNIDILCQVENLTDYYSISWYRKTITGDRTAIYRDDMLINIDLGREAEAYGVHSYYDVTIRQVEGQDLGRLLNGNNYTCEVTVKNTGDVVLVSSGLIVDARYSPSLLYPICESCDFSSDLIGSSITISCYSEPGNPSVQLQWSRNGEAIENLQTTTTHSLIYLNYTFILEADDLESSFSCTNGQQSCNLTDQACVEESSPTMFLVTDSHVQQSCTCSTTVIILSVIIAFLFILVVLEAAANIHLFRKLQQCKDAIEGGNMRTTIVPDTAPDYINVTKPTRKLQQHKDVIEEGNMKTTTVPNIAPDYINATQPITKLQQHKEVTEEVEMVATIVPDTSPAYINIRQPNRDLEAYADLQPREATLYSSLHHPQNQ